MMRDLRPPKYAGADIVFVIPRMIVTVISRIKNASLNPTRSRKLQFDPAAFISR